MYTLKQGNGISYLAKKKYGAEIVAWSLTIVVGLLLGYSLVASIRI